MKHLALVVVYHSALHDAWVYACYEGRVVTHRYVYRDALPPEWVEEIRRDPDQFDPEGEAAGKAQAPGPQAA